MSETNLTVDEASAESAALNSSIAPTRTGSPEFRQEWSRFDHLTDEIEPQLYESVDFAAERPSRA